MSESSVSIADLPGVAAATLADILPASQSAGQSHVTRAETIEKLFEALNLEPVAQAYDLGGHFVMMPAGGGQPLLLPSAMLEQIVNKGRANGYFGLDSAGGGTLAGPLTLSSGPALAPHAATKAYVDAASSASGTSLTAASTALTGSLAALSTAAERVANKGQPSGYMGLDAFGGGTLAAALSLPATPTLGTHAASKSYVDTATSAQAGSLATLTSSTNAQIAALTSSTSGSLTALNTAAEKIANKGQPSGYAGLDSSGGMTLAANLTLEVGPTAAAHAATKGYVDGQVGSTNSSLSALGTSTTASLSATNSTLTALGAAAERIANKGAANGYAALNSAGKVSNPIASDASLATYMSTLMVQGRTMAARAGDSINVRDMFLTGDSDASQMWIRALAAAQANPGLMIEAPGGNSFSISLPLTFGNAPLTIRGHGESSTTLVFSGAGTLLTITDTSDGFNLVRISGLSLNTAPGVTSAAALSLLYGNYDVEGSQAQKLAVVRDISINGSFTIGINSNGLWQSAFENITYWWSAGDNNPVAAAFQIASSIDIDHDNITVYGAGDAHRVIGYCEELTYRKCTGLTGYGFRMTGFTHLVDGVAQNVRLNKLVIEGGEWAQTLGAVIVSGVSDGYVRDAHFVTSENANPGGAIVHLDSVASFSFHDNHFLGENPVQAPALRGLWLSNTLGLEYSCIAHDNEYGNVAVPIYVDTGVTNWVCRGEMEYTAGQGYEQVVYDQTGDSPYNVYDYLYGVGGAYPLKVENLQGGIRWVGYGSLGVAFSGSVLRLLPGGGTTAETPDGTPGAQLADFYMRNSAVGTASGSSATVTLGAEGGTGSQPIGIKLQTQAGAPVTLDILEITNVAQFGTGNQSQFAVSSTTTVSGTVTTALLGYGAIYGGSDGMMHVSGGPGPLSLDGTVAVGIMKCTNVVQFGPSNQAQWFASSSGTTTQVGHIVGATDGLHLSGEAGKVFADSELHASAGIEVATGTSSTGSIIGDGSGNLHIGAGTGSVVVDGAITLNGILFDNIEENTNVIAFQGTGHQVQWALVSNGTTTTLGYLTVGSDLKLHLNCAGGTIVVDQNQVVTGSLTVLGDAELGQHFILDNIATSDPHVVGRIWANNNVLTRSAG